VVAPPGSGKTLIGIEIARRVGRRAVTFSPTTTIQEQWRDKVRLFLPGEPSDDALLDGHVTTDPDRLASITSLTYQSLATATQQREFLDRLGREAWIEELVDAGRTEERARAHVADLEAKAPTVVARAVQLRSRRRKHDLLVSGEASIEQLLHPNALSLIERIVAAETGCLIFDEAHHLLDYWALILARLIARLPDALVVGLTATPPASADPEDMKNYLALVDGIDFEVPTPAVVKSGNLAPYQDLVMVTEPTGPERAFIHRQTQTLEAVVDAVVADPRFVPFVEAKVNRTGTDRSWPSLLEEEFESAVAEVRFLLALGRPVCDDVGLVPEMRTDPDLRDRLALVRAWCLDVLRTSADPADQQRLGDVRAALRTFGMVMTETGWRASSSPIERVLAYSRSKVDGMVRILREESASMGDELRAVVLTDFEHSAALSLRALESVLDPSSGGAVQAIRCLVADPETARLDPVMLTGRTVLVDAEFADRFLGEARTFFEANGLRATLSKDEGQDGLALIDGEGADWRPRSYVACITELFERGVTRCLVATRGLLSEGWDSIALNTLVDLTTAGTFASVNQIRGRSIRLDPARPRKVADNWDVVCVEHGSDEGWSDLRRLVSKHHHAWGLRVSDRRVVKGIGHLDERLALLPLPLLSPQRPTIESINRTALRRARHRDRTYDAWGIGQPYDNFEFKATSLSGDDLRFRTAFTWKRSLRALLNIAMGWLALYLSIFFRGGLLIPDGAPGWVVVATAVPVVLAFAMSAKYFWRYFKAAFIDLPVDSYLADFGRAVAEALRTTGLAAASTDQVRVSLQEGGSFDVHLDSTDRVATELFAEAYRDLFQPIVDQRYLVVREEASLSGTFYRPVWYAIRSLTRIFRKRQRFYHPVPSVFARRRELAEAFARSWSRWVGGGGLVYTRSPEGARILLNERARNRLRVRSAAVDEWR
jgi:superfamily II DNA or RNA helicase